MTNNQLQYAILGVLLYHGPQTRSEIVTELNALGTTLPIGAALANLMVEGVVVHRGQSDDALVGYRINRILLEARAR